MIYGALMDLSGTTFFVTGGAGFIGSNLAERLLGYGAKVWVYDNLSSGNYSFLKPFEGSGLFRFVKGDLLDFGMLSKTMKEAKPDIVVHLAANPDVRRGIAETRLDLEQGTIATYNVLEAMRLSNSKEILFSSSSTVYGDAKLKPTPEHYGPLKPISLYGASKLASEGLITAYAHLFGFRYYIYRFANVVGKNLTHGVIVDFAKKLEKNKKELEVLGNGLQRKSYIDVEDCVDAMLLVREKSSESEIVNLATIGQTPVKRIAEEIVARVAPNAKIRYTGTEQGWPGDIANTWLDNTKMLEIVLKLIYMTSDEAVLHAIDLVVGK
jgi:UDP-glucose 4-epimerase